MRKLALAALCITLLTSCISREQADVKLQKGCKAAIALFMKDGNTLRDIKRTTFKTSTEFGNGFRNVMIFAKISDGWYDQDKEYECVFEENFGAFSSTHNATLYQLKIDDTYYGMKDNMINGDAMMLINIENAVSQAMH